MASSVENCCGVEPFLLTVAKSQSSRGIYFESAATISPAASDCSSPTSWEFHQGLAARATATGIFRTPPPGPAMGLSSAVHTSETVSSPCGKTGETSRNSSGSAGSSHSSTGSHRSHDSGFSDSGGGAGGRAEARTTTTASRRRNNGRRKTTCNSVILDKTVTHVNSQQPQQRHSIPEIYCHTSHKNGDNNINMVNGSLAQYKQYKVCCPHSPCGGDGDVVSGSDETEECSSIYQEVILAHPIDDADDDEVASTISMSTLIPPDMSTTITDLGAPACCSTPKHMLNKNGKYKDNDYLRKIDNFKSLNKNDKKFLDSNNNKNLSHYDTNGNNLVVLRTTASSPQQQLKTLKYRYDASTTQKSFHSGQENETFKDPSVLFPSPSSNVYHRNNETYNINSNNSSSRWQSLPKGFSRVQQQQRDQRLEGLGHTSPSPSSGEVIIVRSQADNDALRLWLHELRYQAEPECLYTLQSKSVLDDDKDDGRTTSERQSTTIAFPLSSNNNGLAIHSISVPLLSIRNVEQMASTISGQFSKICKHLEFGFFGQVPPLVESLADHLDEFLKRHHRLHEEQEQLHQVPEESFFGNLRKSENRLASSCYELRVAAQSLTNLLLTSSTSCSSSAAAASSFVQLSGGGSYLNHQDDTCHSNSRGNEETMALQREFHLIVSVIVEGIVVLGNLFGQVVDQRLTRDLNSILDTIESGGLQGKVALKSFVTILHDGGMHMCRLAASIRTVRGLLGVLLDAKEDNDKILALRCLATMLCVGEAVKDFDKAGGFEIVADILYDSNCSIVIKLEAVSVLAQATDPWIDLETSLMNLGYHLEKIIVSLTSMISYCHAHEDGFLLTMAAISNLTFLEVSSLDLLRRHRTIYLIINVIKAKPDFSIFVLDHVATVLANMAGSERYRKEIVRCGGIVTLLCFLQQRPLPCESAAEIAACERLQQKSTIAISRLCNEEGVPQMVVEMGGMERMVQLCRQDKERNYSDGVLIACLATLRKLVTFCGDGATKGLHADDLIHPRLLDSFLMYSSRQESYV